MNERVFRAALAHRAALSLRPQGSRHAILRAGRRPPGASVTLSPGTAATWTSASAPRPPSRPRVVTVCPAAVHGTARPPPTLPRPRTVIFTRDPFFVQRGAVVSVNYAVPCRARAGSPGTAEPAERDGVDQDRSQQRLPLSSEPHADTRAGCRRFAGRLRESGCVRIGCAIRHRQVGRLSHRPRRIASPPRNRSGPTRHGR
jgi:hypothetical protein